MRRLLIAVVVVLVPVAGVALARQTKSAHVAVNIADLKWGDPPPVFEKGASFAVVSGDPGKPGIFVARLRMPAGYKIAPHWHPTDEHVTVLVGTFTVGMGEKVDNAAMKKLDAGGTCSSRPSHVTTPWRPRRRRCRSRPWGRSRSCT